MKRLTILSTSLFLLLGLFITKTRADSNRALENEVQTAISNINNGNFQITADSKGHVDIQGTVNKLYDKYLIFQNVSDISGVKTISLFINVDTPFIPDNIVLNNVRQAMTYVSGIVEPDRISINVDHGQVFLNGIVSFDREKLLMQTLTSSQEGVRAIVNNLQVLPSQKARSDENLTIVLDQIMKYKFPMEKKADFLVKDGHVTLNGTVTTLWSKNNLAEKFSDVTGIENVQNNLKVKPIA